jgi:SAM-dependent methyltransferase
MLPNDAKGQLTHRDQREFDAYAGDYESLLRDPLRDCFSSGQSVFFHRRKRDLIADRFARRGIDTTCWNYLDVGCGQGELLKLLSCSFATSTGCDTSAGMLQQSGSDRIVLQEDALRLPFENCTFDFVTAVCVYHHVPEQDRAALTREAYRILKPGGTLCIVEHNPLNPITRLIVARSPVDIDAHLLSHWTMRALMLECGFDPEEMSFFMYLPETLYRRARGLEEAFKWLPLGGQYAYFGRRPLAPAQS